MSRSTGSARRTEQGQIIVLFALVLVAVFAMCGLLFDGAQALVTRRQLQDVGDAAALAAANVIQSGSRGCSAVAGPPPGAPRAEVTAAAVASVQAMLPGFPTSDISVTCAADAKWANYAVEVSLGRRSPGFFGAVVGFRGFDVATTSQAINGQTSGLKFSVVLLDPGNLTWPNGRRGCPSFLISGGPTILLEGSVQVNSACAALDGGALGTNGNSATVTMTNASTIRLVGGFTPGPLTLTPAPVTSQKPTRDPLAALPPVSIASLPVRSTNRLTLNSGSTVLQPGVYTGGIQMRNSAKAFLRPGIYVINGGGFSIGSQNAVYSIGPTGSSVTDATWATDCTTSNCGVLVYNTGTATTLNEFTVGAGATVRLRPYLPTADTVATPVPEYKGLLFWQNGTPVPTSAYGQPTVSLNGGGSIDMSGTVYAPSAMIFMTGGSGGSGGSATDLTLQFIAWDLQMQGNSSFNFRYRSDAFARPTDYGLIR